MDKKQLQDLMSKLKAEKSTGDSKTELNKAYNEYLKGKSFDNFDEGIASSKMDQFNLHHVFSRCPSRTRKIWKWGISAAAAVLITFGLVYYSWYKVNSVQSGQPFTASHVDIEIPKIRTEAVAILPNGEEIILNSEGFNTVQDDTAVNRTNLTEQYITLKTPRGGKLNFQLPDGSLVWLNSETTLTYPVSFGDKSRHVKLEGEAYFEVAKQKVKGRSVSFIVDAGFQKIKVLGTKFNVNNYTNEKIKATTLVEGAVEVSDGKNVSQLKPNQQFVQGSDGESVIQVNAQDYISWKEGILRLSRQDFPAVARMIERNYNVKFDHEKLPGGFELNGELMTNVNIDELLKGLGATMGIKFSRNGLLIQIDNINN